MMNFGKKLAIGVASAALVASMGAMAPAAVAADSQRLPGYANLLGRLAGADRIQTSLNVAKHEFGSRGTSQAGHRAGLAKPKVLYVTSAADQNLVDAAAAGMLNDGPLAFITNGTYVANAVGKFFANTAENGAGFTDLSEIVVIGGEGAVSQAAAESVAEGLGISKSHIKRLGGKDRYETSVAVANHIYNQAQLKTNAYTDLDGQPIVKNSNLLRAYLANGDNTHVVDSMVAGTLNDGPILLVQPDGKIPEVVAEFIKKALPEQFAALGGAETVSDATVQEAWIIKTLGNKWDTSYDIPGLKLSVNELRHLVYGAKPYTSRYTTDPAFMGLVNVVKQAAAVESDWYAKYQTAVAKVNGAVSYARNAGTTWGAFQTALAGATATGYHSGSLSSITDAANDFTFGMQQLYGSLVIAGGKVNVSEIENSMELITDDNGTASKTDDTVSSFDFEGFESRKSFSDTVGGATGDLTRVWNNNINGTILEVSNPVAKATQNTQAAGEALAHPVRTSITAGTDVNLGVPMAAVYRASQWVTKMETEWYKKAKSDLEGKEQNLRGQLDKVAPKTELRLGGKDRFETAQLIANQYGKRYGGIVLKTSHNPSVMDEAYVASGYRLADSLTAGQLTRGPILLVKGTEKTGKDLPEFTVNVAKNLRTWTNAAGISVYGVGGNGVLTDEALSLIVNTINSGKPGNPGSVSKLSLSTTNLNYAVSAGAKTKAVQVFFNNVPLGAAVTVTADTSNPDTATTATASNNNPGWVDVTVGANAGTYKFKVAYNGQDAYFTVNVRTASVTPTIDNNAAVGTADAGKTKSIKVTLSASATDPSFTSKVVFSKLGDGTDNKTLDSKVIKNPVDGEYYLQFDVPAANKLTADTSKFTLDVSVTEPGKAETKATQKAITYAPGVSTPFTDPQVGSEQSISGLGAASKTGEHLATISNFAALKSEIEAAHGGGYTVQASDFDVQFVAGTLSDGVTNLTVDLADGKIKGDIAQNKVGNFKVKVQVKAYATGHKTASQFVLSADITASN